jgi:small conductance mechanosensitive channel
MFRGSFGMAVLAGIIVMALGITAAPVGAQGTSVPDLIGTVVPDAGTPAPEAPNTAVYVEPAAQDEQIAGRLERILRATGWFQAPRVAVREGVVFLEGRMTMQEYKDWAGELSKKTQDVVAVVNRIEVLEPSIWDFSPALGEVKRLAQGIVKLLPQILIGFATLVLTWYVAKLVVRIARRVLRHRIDSPLLRDLAAVLFGVPVFILGLYLLLQFFGLTRLALTVLGGTGLAGLVIGIAFSDIAENLLASILVSAGQPFRTGDVVEVGQHRGVVERVTTRSTLLMGLDGNYIQIPNATIYKSTIINYTANPNRRIDFGVEDEAIRQQARETRAPEEGMSLLEDAT